MWRYEIKKMMKKIRRKRRNECSNAWMICFCACTDRHIQLSFWMSFQSYQILYYVFLFSHFQWFYAFFVLCLHAYNYYFSFWISIIFVLIQIFPFFFLQMIWYNVMMIIIGYPITSRSLSFHSSFSLLDFINHQNQHRIGWEMRAKKESTKHKSLLFKQSSIEVYSGINTICCFSEWTTLVVKSHLAITIIRKCRFLKLRTEWKIVCY